MKNASQATQLAFPLLLVFSYLIFTSATCKKIVFDKPSNITPVPLTTAAITDLVEQEMALQNIVGIAIGTVENGLVKHTLAFGHLNESRTTPVTTNTVFRYASLSKPVTALAAFQAITDGHIALHGKIGSYVSYWPSSGNKDDITVAHCLSHRSGIVHYGRDGNENMVCTPSSVATPASTGFNGQLSVDRFDQCDLLSTPGTAHRYSTYAYDLLGAAIEEAVNMDYVAYVNQHIKNVAGLSSLNAFAGSPGGYDYDCNLKREPKDEGNANIKIPGGGWSSNIRDLARLMQGIVNDEFIPTSYALWQDVSFSSDNSNYVYGFKKKTVNGATYAYHGGAHADVRTFMGFFPGDKNGVCVMMNTGESGDAERVGEKLLALMGYSFNKSNLPTNNNNERTDCGERMVAVWRQTGNAEETVIRRGLTHDNFLQERNAMQDKDWYLVDMETYLDDGVRKWGGIFRKGVTSTSIWRNFTTDGFFEKWEEENAAGRRLIDIEAYESGSEIRWAGLFQSGNSGNYAMWRGFSSEDFGDKHEEMKAQGRKLIDVETYTVGNSRKWAGVWLGTGAYLLNRNYQQDEFVQLCRERADAGYRLVDVETYMDGNVRKFAGVWEPDTTPEARWFNIDIGNLINEKHNDLITKDYELLDLEKY